MFRITYLKGDMFRIIYLKDDMFCIIYLKDDVFRIYLKRDLPITSSLSPCDFSFLNFPHRTHTRVVYKMSMSSKIREI